MNRKFLKTGPLLAIVLITASIWSGVELAAMSFTELAENTHLHGLAVDPTDPSRLLIATHNGIYVLSRDRKAERRSQSGDDFMSLTPHPSDASVLFASGHPEGGGNLGLIISRDGGRTWRSFSKGAVGRADFHSFDVSKADPSVAYGVYGGFQMSRDGGQTWQLRGPLLDRIMDLAASVTDPATVFGATYDGLLISRNGGMTWEATTIDKKPVSLVRTHGRRVYAFVVGTGLMRATEPALEWELVSAETGGRIIGLMAFDPSNADRFYAITHGRELLESMDGGRTWRQWGLF